MAQKNVQKTVLITGGAKRLGRAVALAVAQAGWNIALHYRASEQQALETAQDCELLGVTCKIFKADLNDEKQTKNLIPSIVETMGSLDAVVNNASTFEYDVVQDFNYENLIKHMLSNVGAPVLLSQALQKHVKARNAQGAVVNVLDQKLWNVNPDFLSYSLSKAALHMANNMMAQALAPVVRVCAIAPGLTFPSHLQTEDDFKRARKYSLTGEVSHPSDVAKAVVFMLDTTSISGATLLVDGGQHLVAMPRDVSFL